MPDYGHIKHLLTTSLPQQETALSLMAEAFHSRVWLYDRPTEKVCVLFHGFTAGPHQMVPLGEQLFAAGYNVIAPLMPGHGRAGDWSKQNPPPLPTDARTYLKFGVQWLNLAQMLGQKVVVGGLSGGGTLAAWLALEKTEQVDRAVLFAPYLSASSKVVDLFVEHLDTYYQWDKPSENSYPGFETASLRAILDIGRFCLKRVKQKSIAPTFIISSESDKAVSNFDHRRFFEAALEQQPTTWHLCFDRVLDIPHTMMTKEEGNSYQHLLNSLAQAFIESQLTWSDICEIGYCMTQGRTFPEVIAELGWQQKASKDMPVVMTMVDKHAIAVERQLQVRTGHRLRQIRRAHRDR